MIQHEHFINGICGNKRPIYKVGYTTRRPMDRIVEYPDGSRTIAVSEVRNARVAETALLAELRSKFESITCYSKEMFIGEKTKILTVFYSVALLHMDDSDDSKDPGSKGTIEMFQMCKFDSVKIIKDDACITKLNPRLQNYYQLPYQKFTEDSDDEEFIFPYQGGIFDRSTRYNGDRHSSYCPSDDGDNCSDASDESGSDDSIDDEKAKSVNEEEFTQYGYEFTESEKELDIRINGDIDFHKDEIFHMKYPGVFREQNYRYTRKLQSDDVLGYIYEDDLEQEDILLRSSLESYENASETADSLGTNESSAGSNESSDEN